MSSEGPKTLKMTVNMPTQRKKTKKKKDFLLVHLSTQILVPMLFLIPSSQVPAAGDIGSPAISRF